MSMIILVLWPFSLTVIELSALLNDGTGSFSSSAELSSSQSSIGKQRHRDRRLSVRN